MKKKNKNMREKQENKVVAIKNGNGEIVGWTFEKEDIFSFLKFQTGLEPTEEC